MTNENKEQREQGGEASRAYVLGSKTVVKAFIYTPFANGKSRKFSVKVGARAPLPAVSFEQGKNETFLLYIQFVFSRSGCSFFAALERTLQAEMPALRLKMC